MKKIAPPRRYLVRVVSVLRELTFAATVLWLLVAARVAADPGMASYVEVALMLFPRLLAEAEKSIGRGHLRRRKHLRSG